MAPTSEEQAEAKEKKDLAEYVEHYLKKGHDPEKIKTLLKEYPLIKDMFDGRTVRRESPSKSTANFFSNKEGIDRSGDQILYYAGRLNPDLAKNLCIDICNKFDNKEHVDQNAFIKTMKLVNRLGSPELVGVVLKDFLESTNSKVGFSDILPQDTLKQAYKFISEKGFTSKPDFNADPRQAFVQRIMKN